MTSPVLKWAGGKRRLVPQLLAVIKELDWRQGNYLEPFVGGGALFFALYDAQMIRASKGEYGDVLGDANHRLIHTYSAIKTRLGLIKTHLRTHILEHSKEYYLQLRSLDIDGLSNECLAAWMLYMNKAGFNGLYRVNQKTGKLNVPFGDKDEVAFDHENLASVSKTFQSVDLFHGDFEGIFSVARKGDLIYCDPPYIPLTTSSSFTRYTKDGFTYEDQVRLRDAAVKAAKAGANVILSNSGSALVRELYADEDVFSIREVSVRHQVGAKTTSRGHVTEHIIVARAR